MASFLAVILALLVVTYLHVVIGELVPKGIALSHAERVALFVSTPVRWFFVVARPLIWLLEESTNVLLRGLGLEPPGAHAEAHSEAELRMLLTSSAEQGEIEHEEQEMLSKVFDFADKEVSDVMVPRPEVVAISIALPPPEALKSVLESPYTRYPVYRESLDDIVGVLHIRDLIEAMMQDTRHRRRRSGAARARRLHGSRDERPRLAPDRVPAHEPAHGGRDRRVRLDGGHRHARGPARGDRR